MFLSSSGETLEKPILQFPKERLAIGSRIIKVHCSWRISRIIFSYSGSTKSDSPLRTWEKLPRQNIGACQSRRASCSLACVLQKVGKLRGSELLCCNV